MGKLVKKIAVGAAIIGLAVATGGISLAPSAGLLGVSVATSGVLGSLALSAGAGLILGGLSGALAKKPHVSNATTDRLTANLVLDTPRKMVFGRTAFATDIRYQEWNGTDQDILDQVLVLASHGVTSIDEVWFEDKLAWTVTGGAQGQYVGYFWCDGIFEATAGGGFNLEGGRWTSTTGAMRGCAQVHFRFKLTGTSKKTTSPFSSSVPTRVTIRGRAARVYDPRQDSSVGGTGPMRAADQATWAWTAGGQDIGRNLPLQLLWYLLGWRIDDKLAVGRGLPVDRIDLDSFMTAANLAWESVLRADGTTEPRYRGDGTFSEGDDPKQVIATFEASMNGKLRDRNGKLSLQLFHNDLATPVLDFTEHDVLGDFTWSPGESLEAKKNIIRGRYTDPSDSSLYQLVDYPAVSLPSLDGIDRIDPVDYALVQSPSQAQRLAKQRLQRLQYPGSFSASVNAKGWAVQDGDVVRLRFPALGFDNKLFRVDASTVDPSGVVPIVLIEEHASIYAWDADERAAVVGAAPGTYNPLLVPIVQAIDDAASSAIWNAITGTGKPADNATNSGDPTSAFGSSTVGSYIDRVVDIETILAPSGEIDDRIAEISAALDADPTTVTNQRVTVLEATTRQGAPNLVINGDFGDYDSTTGVIRGWTKSGSGWGVVLADRGTFAQITGGNGATLRQNVPAYGGNGYSFGIEGDPDSSTGSQTYLEWRNNSGVSLGTTPSLYPDNWGRVSSPVYTAPPGTASAEIVLRQNATGSTSISRWSHVQVQLGEPTLWTDPATTRSNAGRITSEEITRAGQTGSLAARASALEAQFAGTTGSYLKSVIDANQTTASSQYATVASQVNTLTSSITALSAPNLIGNGRFANGFSGWTTGGSGTWSVVTAYDEPFAQFTGSSFGYAFTDISNVLPNKPYCIGYEADPDAGQGADMYVEFWSAGFGSQLAVHPISGSDDWARVNGGAYTTPSGTAVARVGIQTSGSGTGTRRWRRIQFQQSTTPTDYSDSASLSALQSQVTIQAGTLASLGGQVTTQGSTLSGLSGTVAGQVTALGSLTTKVSVRTLAYWASEATTGGATAFITGRAEMTDGTVTSSVAIGAKEFWVYNEVSGAWVKTFGVVGGNVLIYGNLAVSGSVSVGNLQFGATGNVSKYYKQSFNDNSQTDWSAGPMGVGIVSQQGSPIEGRAVLTATNIGSASGTTYVRVIRVTDGTVVWGGANGVPFKFPTDGTFGSVSIDFMDSVAAGHGEQYDVRVRQTGGANLRSVARSMTVRELVRDKFDQIHLEAPAGEGPGAGSNGGGQINGDGDGAGGAGGTTGTGTITTGGLRWKQIET